MKTKIDFIEVLPGVKILKTKNLVEGCYAANPCASACGAVADFCRTGGVSDCSYLQTVHVDTRNQEGMTANSLCVA
jgi:hypothetical protein